MSGIIVLGSCRSEKVNSGQNLAYDEKSSQSFTSGECFHVGFGWVGNDYPFGLFWTSSSTILLRNLYLPHSNMVCSSHNV